MCNVGEEKNTHLYSNNLYKAEKMETKDTRENAELEKARSHIIVEIIEYVSNSVNGYGDYHSCACA